MDKIENFRKHGKLGKNKASNFSLQLIGNQLFTNF
jgi:hypothetical protein